MRDFINSRLKEIRPSGIRRFFDMAASVSDAIGLSVGEPDFDTPWHITEEGIYALEKGQTFYTSNAGMLELREEISRYLKRKYGLSYDKDEIIVTIGGSEGIDLSFRACLTAGDEVIIADPGYVSYEPCAKLTGATVVRYVLEEADEFKIKADKLRHLITEKTKALLINYPNNPTGAIMTEEDLRPIAELCIEKDLLLVTDEIYSELTYEGEHFSIASLPGMKDRVLYINGFSKAYSMTGWRLGYLCGPKSLMQHIYKIHQYGVMAAPTISQFAGIEALKNGDDDIVAMREEYERRRNYISNRLREIKIPCFEPKGAFYCFLNIQKYGMTSEEFALKLLQTEQVILVPGTAFGESGEGFLRLSYAYSMEKIKLGLDRLAHFIEGLNK